MGLSVQSRDKLNDWLKWYNEWAPRADQMPMEQRVAWCCRAVSGAYHCIVEIARETDRLGRGNTHQLPLSEGGILLPTTRWR